MSGGAEGRPLRALRRVRVGSIQPPKLDAVRSAFAAYAPDAEIEGIEVESGVPEQPVGLEEIVTGARNRAERAGFEAGELGVGLEDGLLALPAGVALGGTRHVNVGCAVITDGRRVALGFSSAFAYPPACSARAARERAPIGELFDGLWAERRGEVQVAPSARGTGNVGKLTAGVLPRSEYARHAVLCALVPFLNPDLYDDGSGAR